MSREGVAGDPPRSRVRRALRGGLSEVSACRDAGKARWASLTGEYDLRPNMLALLTSFCHITVECGALREAIAEQGLTVEGSRAPVRPHPLIGALAHSRDTSKNSPGPVKCSSQERRRSRCRRQLCGCPVVNIQSAAPVRNKYARIAGSLCTSATEGICSIRCCLTWVAHDPFNY